LCSEDAHPSGRNLEVASLEKALFPFKAPRLRTSSTCSNSNWVMRHFKRRIPSGQVLEGRSRTYPQHLAPRLAHNRVSQVGARVSEPGSNTR
jgi:hypothetical protein